MTGFGTALSPSSDHRVRFLRPGAGDDAGFGDGEAVAALFADDTDAQEPARLERGALRNRDPDQDRIVGGIDVLPDERHGPAGEASGLQFDRLAGLEKGGFPARHPGRDDEAVEGDDLGQDGAGVHGLADAGVEPDQRAGKRRGDLMQGQVGLRGGQIAPGGVELLLRFLICFQGRAVGRQELFLAFERRLRELELFLGLKDGDLRDPGVEAEQDRALDHGSSFRDQDLREDASHGGRDQSACRGAPVARGLRLDGPVGRDETMERRPDDLADVDGHIRSRRPLLRRRLSASTP